MKKTTKKKAKKKIKITGKTMLSKVVEINPNAGEILFEHGMHCIGCAMAGDETLAQGCMAHGMPKKDFEQLLRKLNK